MPVFSAPAFAQVHRMAQNPDTRMRQQSGEPLSVRLAAAVIDDHDSAEARLGQRRHQHPGDGLRLPRRNQQRQRRQRRLRLRIGKGLRHADGDSLTVIGNLSQNKPQTVMEVSSTAAESTSRNAPLARLLLPPARLLLPPARLLLLLLVCAVCANSMHNAFHFDDFHTVVDNPAIRSLRHVPEFFTDTTTFSVLPANRTYRPIVSTMLALDYALGHGYVPFWFHLSTLLLFLLLIYLVARLSEAAFDRTQPSASNAWLGLLVAAWFGLHPAMAETVNYVIQRGDVYCTLGCVAGLYVYVRYPRLRRSGLYLLPFAAALLSKPPAAVFPLLLGVWLLLFEAPTMPARQRMRSVLLSVTPSLAVTALLLWLQSAMTPKSFLPTLLSAADYRWTQPYVWLRYFGELWLPLHLNVDTDLAPVSRWSVASLAGLAFVAALLAAIWASCRRPKLRPVAFGLLWFVLTQLPTSLYPLSELENDHRMFFSFVGLMLAVVWSGWLLWLRAARAFPLQAARWQTALLVVMLLALGAYAWGTLVRNQVWRTEETLWQDDVLKSPKNGRGLMNYALTQMANGSYPVALDYFTRAHAYTPNYPTLEINLGIVNGAMADQAADRQDAAEAGYRAAEAERHFLRAIALAPADDVAHAYYGRWLSAHGRLPEAIAQLRTAVQLNPLRSIGQDELILASTRSHSVAFWIDLSLSQYRQGQFAGCIASARRALAIDPHSAEAYNNLGAAYAGLGQWDEAIASDREALRANPELQIAKNNLAWSLSQKKLQAEK